MRQSLRMGKLFGIEFRIDSSWILVLVLVVWSLASLFARWHPDWPAWTSFVVAGFAALAFFGSVLLHELAHSLVARFGYGIPVRDITLHMFGGVSNIEREPPTPTAEFLIAIVGPISSIVLGVAMLIAGAVVTGLANTGTALDPEATFARMGPITTMLMWLGPVNIAVGVFNLIPGFPLDGGRILRSLIWRSTNDLGRATRAAARVGELVGWAFVGMGVLMALGVRIPFFGRGIVGGIWLGLIGMFLRNAAMQHYIGSTVHDALEGVRVRDLVRARGPWVGRWTPVRMLIDQWFTRSDASAFPVFDDGQFVGVVTLEDVRGAHPREWDVRYAGDLMTPVDRLAVVSPDDAAFDALRRLGGTPATQLPVVGPEGFVGMLHEQDLLRFIDLASARLGRSAPRPRHA